MNSRFLLVVPMLCLCAWSSEKEVKLSDGRILRGEVLGEEDGQLLLALKAGNATAKIRVAKDRVLSVKDAPPARPATVEKTDAPQQAVVAAASDAKFARARELLAKAKRERDRDEDALMATVPQRQHLYPGGHMWPWQYVVQPDHLGFIYAEPAALRLSNGAVFGVINPAPPPAAP